MEPNAPGVLLRPADPSIEQVDLGMVDSQVQRATSSLAAGHLTAAALDLEDAVAVLRGVLARRDREAKG